MICLLYTSSLNSFTIAAVIAAMSVPSIILYFVFQLDAIFFEIENASTCNTQAEALKFRIIPLLAAQPLLQRFQLLLPALRLQ